MQECVGQFQFRQSQTHCPIGANWSLEDPVSIRIRPGSAGMRAGEVRALGFAALAVIGGLTAYGTFAPLDMTVIPVGDVDHADDNVLVALIASYFVIIVAGGLGILVGYRIFERRWLWPFGPRVADLRPGSQWPHAISNAVGLFVGLVAPRLLGVQLGPHLSGLWVTESSPERWLRVNAPIDIAFTMIASFALYLAAYVATLAATLAIVGRLAHADASAPAS